MIQPPKIELSKTRNFSEIIGDTFQFIKENFKPLITCFFVFCGFFLVATFIALFLHQQNLVSLTNSINNPDSYDTPTNPMSVFGRIFDTQFLVGMVFECFQLVMAHVCIISYVAIYKAKGNQQPTLEEVWGYVKHYFFRVLGSSIVLWLLIFVATLFCILPGVWLYPVVGLMIPMMIVENGSLGYVFSQAFRIIKDNWWTTFGVAVVTILIAMIMSGIVTMPSSILAFGSLFLHKGKGNGSAVFMAIYYACSALTSVFYMIFTIGMTITYFSLNEIKEGTGLMERINQMGNDQHQTDLPAEEY